MLTGLGAGDAARLAARRLRRLRDRLRLRQRADHERRRVRDAARAGGRRRGDRHDLAPGRADARRRGRRRDRASHCRRRPLGRHPAWWTLAACGAVVLVLGLRGDHRPRAARRRGGRRPSSIRRRSPLGSGGWTPTDAAREVWLLMSDLVLDHTRRREVSEALGMSFGRARAIRRLARRPMSMRELADGARDRPAQRDRRRRRPRGPGARPPAAASHRPARQAGRGDAQGQGRWRAVPTRSSPRRRPRSARSATDDLEALRRILTGIAAHD